MSEEKEKKRYKAKPRGWSKSEDEERIDSSKKKNPSQENDMDEKGVQALIDKSNEKIIDIFSKKLGGDMPPGGDKMDQDTKEFLGKIGESVEKHGKMLEGLFGEQQRKENEARFQELIKEQIKPVQEALTKRIGEVEKKFCNEDGTVCFFTKEELENWKKSQIKEIEKMKEETKKAPEGKPDISQLSNKELYNQLIKSETAVKDLKKVHIEKALEDADYRKEFLDALCDNEQCRVDVMKKVEEFSKQKEETEKKEKTPEGKPFFLTKKE